jgi:ectoine hydroxylase-related dioxygenase (phytanoyl-CoA dioxygenase family)
VSRRAGLTHAERRKRWRAHGYFVLQDFASAAEVADLRSSCDAVLEHQRRTSREAGHSSTYIEGLLDPQRFAHEPERLQRMVDFFGSRRVCELVHDLASPLEGPVWLKTLQYFHEPTTRDWDGDWHRDSQFGRDPLLEQAYALTTTAARFRVAFLPDDWLEVVPGTHARWDTDEELAIRKGSARTSASMPGAVRITLAPGDACVFHAWTIHRATYRRSPLRRTLDGMFRYGEIRRRSFS